MRYWILGLFGLWAAWLAYTFLSQLLGFTWGTVDYTLGIINATGIPFPKEVRSAIERAYSWFAAFWQWMPPTIFFAFIIYIILNSMRRRIDEEVW